MTQGANQASVMSVGENENLDNGGLPSTVHWTDGIWEIAILQFRHCTTGSITLYFYSPFERRWMNPSEGGPDKVGGK
jgi:hypothetical protein